MEAAILWMVGHSAVVALITSELLALLPTRSNSLIQLIAQGLETILPAIKPKA